MCAMPTKLSLLWIYSQANKAECIQCDSGYYLKSDKTCTSCGEGNEYFISSGNSEPKCIKCFSGKFFSDSKCLVCPVNCKTCKYDSNNNIKCNECNYQYTLASDGSCSEPKLVNIFSVKIICLIIIYIVIYKICVQIQS